MVVAISNPTYDDIDAARLGQICYGMKGVVLNMFRLPETVFIRFTKRLYGRPIFLNRGRLFDDVHRLLKTKYLIPLHKLRPFCARTIILKMMEPV